MVVLAEVVAMTTTRSPSRKRKIRHPGAITTTKQYPHGTNACYSLNRCHCDPCSQAHAEYEATRKLWTGQFPRVPPPLVDPGPARRHVNKLRAKGMGSKRIAHLAGLPESAVGSLIWGRYNRAAKKIRRQTADKLLAVRYEALGSMLVPAAEGLAIIEELLARGWWKAAIAQRIGSPAAKSLQIIKHSGCGLMQASKLRGLRELLDEPVPMRRHNQTGRFFQPKGRPSRPVPRTTEGLPGDPPASMDAGPKPRPTPKPQPQLEAARALLCRVCSRPLVDHKLTERCA